MANPGPPQCKDLHLLTASLQSNTYSNQETAAYQVDSRLIIFALLHWIAHWQVTSMATNRIILICVVAFANRSTRWLIRRANTERRNEPRAKQTAFGSSQNVLVLEFSNWSIHGASQAFKCFNTYREDACPPKNKAQSITSNPTTFTEVLKCMHKWKLQNCSSFIDCLHGVDCIIKQKKSFSRTLPHYVHWWSTKIIHVCDSRFTAHSCSPSCSVVGLYRRSSWNYIVQFPMCFQPHSFHRNVNIKMWLEFDHKTIVTQHCVTRGLKSLKEARTYSARVGRIARQSRAKQK